MISDTISDKILAPLYEPEPVTFTFDALGWKVVAGMLIATFLTAIGMGIYRYLSNRYRRTALSYLRSDTSVEATFIVLKQAAMHAYGRERVGALSGKQWLAFLDKTAHDVQFSKLEESICHALYKELTLSNEEIEEIKINAKKWIKTHARKL